MSQAADGLVLDHRQFAVTESGPRISPPLSPPSIVPGPPAGVGRRPVGRARLGVHGHVLRRCWQRTIRRATGDDWLDGEVVGRGTRFDANLVVGHRQATSTRSPAPSPGARDPVIDEPGAVDVTVLRPSLAAALVAGDDPHVVVYSTSTGFSGDAAGRAHGVGRARRSVAPSSDSMSPWWCSPATPRATNNASLTMARRSTSSSGGTIAEFDLPEPLRKRRQRPRRADGGDHADRCVVGRHARARAGLVPAVCRKFQHRRHLGVIMNRTHASLVGLVALVAAMCLARLVARHPGGDPEQQRTDHLALRRLHPLHHAGAGRVRVLGDRRARRPARPVGRHDPDSHRRPAAHRRLRAGARAVVRHRRRSGCPRHRELRPVAAPGADRRPPGRHRHRRARHRPAECDRLPRPAGRMGVLRGVGRSGRRVRRPARRRRRRLRPGRPRPDVEAVRDRRWATTGSSTTASRSPASTPRPTRPGSPNGSPPWCSIRAWR